MNINKFESNFISGEKRIIMAAIKSVYSYCNQKPRHILSECFSNKNLQKILRYLRRLKLNQFLMQKSQKIPLRKASVIFLIFGKFFLYKKNKKKKNRILFIKYNYTTTIGILNVEYIDIVLLSDEL